MNLSDFDFDLPDKLIALNPAKPRDSSKLLRINASESFEDTIFSELTNYLNEGDVLVVNDTKVIPSKIIGYKVNIKKELTKISFTFFENRENGQWRALAKPARKINKNDLIFFKNTDDKFYNLFAQIINKNEGEVTFDFASDSEKFINILKEKGDVMLPPYITSKRDIKEEDHSDYQTIFQNNEGSIAAPTAGLHFTDDLIKKIQKKGIAIEKLTLNIGLGTFLPLREDSVEDNTLHSEYCYLSKKTAENLNEVKNSKNRRIVCVGTTALRTLETSFEKGIFKPINKKTNKFIYPGIDINSIDALITNFHLPKSSLFILICALMGTNKMIKAYEYAIKNNYRFYSYGDACLLEK
jgi:S-adenosylmethionine:tRNA ribosyltransferase-isomerase